MNVARTIGGRGDSGGELDLKWGIGREFGRVRTAPVHCVGYGCLFGLLGGFIRVRHYELSFVLLTRSI